jgi:hypothetical protein
MPQAVGAYVVNALALEGVSAVVVSTLVEAVVTVAISQAVSSVLGSGSSTGQGGTTAAQNLNTTIRQAAAARRLIYGTVKAGGILAYPAQTADGTYVDLAIILGEGPLHGIDTTLWLADELSTEAKFAGLVELTFYNGAPGQVASASLIARSSGEWTSAAVGNGVAWVHVRLQFDRQAFPRGLVLPAFLAYGRKVYDPRTDATAFNANPALCALDYLRSEYGPRGGVPDWMIDFSSFSAAASICEEVLDSIDPANVVDGVPGKVRRYELNGAFEVSSSWTQIKETMEQAMAGKIVFVNGKYRCYAGAWRAPTGPTLTSEYLRGDPSYRTHPGRQQRYNIARGTYREPLQDWQNTDYHEQRLDQAIIDEDGEIVQTVNFPATTNGAQAQRLARIAMNQARSAVPLVLPCNFAVFQWQEWDTLTVDLPEVGAQGVYLITNYAYQLAEDGGGIDLTLVPHLASDFDWDPAEHEKIVQPVVRPAFNSAPAGVTGLVVVGSELYSDPAGAFWGLRATWNASSDAFFRHYEIQYKPTAESVWLGGNAIAVASWDSPLSVGVEYDFRVRVVRTDETFSPWATETSVLVSGDTTPPGVPTDLSVTGTTSHTVHWRNPVDVDVMRGKVYVNNTTDPGTATEIATVFGLPDTVYASEPYTPGFAPAYYWVAALDRSNNPSARTYAGSAS